MANSTQNPQANLDPLKSSRDLAIILPDSDVDVPARSKETQILSNVPNLQIETLPAFKSSQIIVERGQDRKVSLVADDGETYPLKINRATEISFTDGRRTSIVLTQCCTVMSEGKYFVAIAITDRRGKVLVEEAIIDHVDPCFRTQIDLENSLRKLSDNELSVLLTGENRWLITNASGHCAELCDAIPEASIKVRGVACVLALGYLRNARESGISIKKTVLKMNGHEISVLASIRSDTGVSQYTPPFHKPAITFTV